MSGNSFGKIFRITTFGESHGKAIGMVIDGCPAGLEISEAEIQYDLNRRRPGQSDLTTKRSESDKVEILSGIFENKTTGAPLALLIANEDQRPKDYSHLQHAFRPSHADYTYMEKYGLRDYRGGGRSSARETAARVAAGAVAKALLKRSGISVQGFVSAVHTVALNKSYTQLDLSLTESNMVRCPDSETAQKMMDAIRQTQSEGDSLGGIISCVIKNCPVGLGEPVFDKLHADLGKAMLSINAVHGFDYGSGFEGTTLKGSQHNDEFEKQNERIITKSNHSGGIQGGISNGMDIYFRVAFKPVATIMMEQDSVNDEGENIIIEGKGRHDPCVLPRAVPIVEAMAALVLADHYLRNKTARI
jgi:chorismate synthase